MRLLEGDHRRDGVLALARAQEALQQALRRRVAYPVEEVADPAEDELPGWLR